MENMHRKIVHCLTASVDYRYFSGDESGHLFLSELVEHYTTKFMQLYHQTKERLCTCFNKGSPDDDAVFDAESDLKACMGIISGMRGDESDAVVEDFILPCMNACAAIETAGDCQ